MAAGGPSCEVFSIGHSVHPKAEFVRLLGRHGIEALADVRRFPASRRHPQFAREALRESLAGAGVSYHWLGDDLGGRRRPRPGSPNGAWRVAGFRGYADHMATSEFARSLAQLEALARAHRTAFMCAEGDWRRCHRRLIADLLLVRGRRVCHILRDGGLEDHALPPFAVASDGRLAYPAPQERLDVSG